jgi:glycosyltransferase involved in cell wall biosynthesis
MRGVLSAFYRLSVNHDRVRVVVQNPDDARWAEGHFGVSRERITLVRGSGVDLQAFARTPEPKDPVTVTMASRLLKDKGVREFIQAAASLRGQHPSVRFQLAGDSAPGNPSSLTEADLDQIRREGHVDLLGYRSDIPNLFSESHVVVLPSYREGLPKVLLEAAASGRSVVTTDVPGCRDAIAPGTGFLVPPRDAPALARAIQVLVEDGVLRRQMGEAGRVLAEREFDIQRVVEAHLKIYEELGNSR